MKLFTISLVMAMSMISSYGQIGTWTAKQSMSVERSTHAGFSINGKGYVCAGAKASASTGDLDDLWEYDPSSNSWSQKANFPGGKRREVSGFAIDSFGYVGHGRNVAADEIFFSFYTYNPRTNSWSQIASCPVKRYAGAGFSIDSIGYVTCGIVPGVARYKDLYAYSPTTNKWTQKTSLPGNVEGRTTPSVTSCNHKGYLNGGFNGPTLNEFFEYDPIQDNWTQKATYPKGERSYAAMFSMGNYVVMGMGRNASDTDFQDVHYFDPSKNTWTRMKDYPQNNSAGHISFKIGTSVYIAGGNTRAGIFRTDLYELSAKELSVSKNMNNNSILKVFKPISKNAITSNLSSGNFELSVYDMSGKLIFKNKETISSDEQKTVDITSISAGLYLVQVKNNSLQSTLKVYFN
jgi:N-acetylneuraminic acid mutarotase